MNALDEAKVKLNYFFSRLTRTFGVLWVNYPTLAGVASCFSDLSLGVDLHGLHRRSIILFG
jgi:hypothetical protein